MRKKSFGKYDVCSNQMRNKKEIISIFYFLKEIRSARHEEYTRVIGVQGRRKKKWLRNKNVARHGGIVARSFCMSLMTPYDTQWQSTVYMDLCREMKYL